MRPSPRAGRPQEKRLAGGMFKKMDNMGCSRQPTRPLAILRLHTIIRVVLFSRQRRGALRQTSRGKRKVNSYQQLLRRQPLTCYRCQWHYHFGITAANKQSAPVAVKAARLWCDMWCVSPAERDWAMHRRSTGQSVTPESHLAARPSITTQIRGILQAAAAGTIGAKTVVNQSAIGPRDAVAS